MSAHGKHFRWCAPGKAEAFFTTHCHPFHEGMHDSPTCMHNIPKTTVRARTIAWPVLRRLACTGVRSGHGLPHDCYWHPQEMTVLLCAALGRYTTSVFPGLLYVLGCPPGKYQNLRPFCGCRNACNMDELFLTRAQWSAW